MMWWYEALPGFWLPRSFEYDAARWPDYTSELYQTMMDDVPERLTSVLELRGWGRPSRRAWGAWMTAYREDKPLKRGWSELEMIADRMYDTARYQYLVPAWRRAITRLINAIDDIEDQVSTILWVAEWIARKVIPLPPTLMSGAQKLQRSLDCAERVVAGITPFRGSKSEYANCLREAKAKKDELQRRKAGLLAWFSENWGRLLEAAQATGQWFNVGIILGPIMGWIEEGMWGVARKTLDNYLIAADALMPGYRQAFYDRAQEMSEAVSRAWEESWEGLKGWTTEEIQEHIGFVAP